MKRPLLLCLTIMLATTTHAQSTDQPVPPLVGEGPVPATLVGQRAPRELLSERVSTNYLTGGIAITQLFTDNALLSAGDKISDLSYTIEPRLAINHSAPRLSYSLGILAGFIVNRTLDEHNQATQSASLDLSYGLARFTTLRVSESFLNTTGLSSGANGTAASDSGGGVGVIQAPNSALYTYGHFRTNTALVELSRQFALRDTGGIRGTISSNWFPESATAPGVGVLYGGQIYSAEAFYNHQFDLRDWVGITLRAQRFDIDRLTGRTDTASLLFMYARMISSNTSLSVFAGPELSNSSLPAGIPAPSFVSQMWSPAAGAVFSWRHQRTSTTLAFSHQVNNGGGLPSAATLTGADADILHQLTRRLTTDVGFSYTQSVPIISSNSTIRTYSGRLQFTYSFHNNFTVVTGYSRDHNTYLGSNGTATANRVWVSFACDFSRALR